MVYITKEMILFFAQKVVLKTLSKAQDLLVEWQRETTLTYLLGGVTDSRLPKSELNQLLMFFVFPRFSDFTSAASTVFILYLTDPTFPFTVFLTLLFLFFCCSLFSTFLPLRLRNLNRDSKQHSCLNFTKK